VPHRRFAFLSGILVFCHASQIAAHDFWLQPSEYWISPDSLTPLTLQVGHGPFRQRSPIPARRITRFQAVAPEGAVIDLHEQLRPGGSADDGDFRLKNLGAYVLVLQTDDHARRTYPRSDSMTI
jgi:Domain of unknown function (DUF4198)